MVTGSIQHQAARLPLRMVLFGLLGIYFFGQFVSYYLQGSYFNQQYFFHLHLSTITETWRAYYPQFLTFIGWMGCLMAVLWFSRSERTLEHKPFYLSFLVLVLALAFDPGLRDKAITTAQTVFHIEDGGLVSVDFGELGLNQHAMQLNDLDSIDWEGLYLHEAALNFNEASAAKPGKNLLLIFMEGFDRLYTDETVFPGLTPNLKALNAEGWQLERLMPVAGSSWTMGGLVSSLCGTPLLHQWHFGGNNIMFTNFLNRARCLPDVLHDAGYEQTFMGGASLKFAGKGHFLKTHSYDAVYGSKTLRKRLPASAKVGDWGLYDDDLLDLAARSSIGFQS
ncbi:MAG: sulfatase-like hydrolase/transferase [Xanthomonadales bacterium]|nr:sulfatase-like hydrolase/transferase [Xanthomonadales bacterium]